MLSGILIFSLMVCASLALTCGGNCPSNNCPKCICPQAVDDVSISAWCAKYTGWSQSCCECIAKHESGGNAHAENHNSNGSYDIGLWQINDSNWGSGSCPGGAPCTPQPNLECAIQVHKWGSNTWRLWSTCGACGCCGRS